MLKNFHYNCNKLGNIANLKIEEIKKKRLKKNNVRVAIQAIGLNYVDILMIKGKYQHKIPAPFTPGIEACGIIIEESCNNKKLINKKVIINKKGGCFSEEIALHFDEIIIIPQEIDSALAAGMFVNTLTSYVSLCEIIKLKKNQNILITGASGGVGSASIKLARSIGAKTVAIVSSKNKETFVRKLGANKTIMLNSKELESISSYRNKYQVDIILDINGLIKTKKILSFLKWKGKYIIIGFMDENYYNIPTQHILIKGLSIFGVRAGEYLKKSSNKKQIINQVIKLIKKDNINAIDYKLVGFRDLKKSLINLKNRTSVGKYIVITKFYKKIYK